eukprot:gene14041-18832_t
MNLHTFKDAVTSKRSALFNDLDEDDNDDNDAIGRLKRDVEGEEDDGAEKFNEAGEVIEPFNLKNEREGGHFDDQMNYVFKKERGEVDAWVADLDEASMEKAIGEAALALKKKNAKQLNDEQSAEFKQRLTPQQLKMELLTILQRGETVNRAMRRLSGKDVQTKSNNPPIKRRVNPDKVSTDTNNDLDSNSKQQLLQLAKQNRVTIDRLTEIADELMSSGMTNIYQITFEAIEASCVMWEYKGLDDLIYGPYSSQQISEWKQGGYLTGENAVLMRRVNNVYGTRNSGSKIKFSNIKSKDSADHPNSKKVKSSHQELLDDFDDDDGDNIYGSSMIKNEDKKEEISDNIQDENWISSDAIDFGVHIFLTSDDYDAEYNVNKIRRNRGKPKNGNIKADAKKPLSSGISSIL